MDKFPCTMCGCCCKRIGTLSVNKEMFPYKIVDGVCEMLKNNKCKVYDNRPLLCDIERLASFIKADKEDFFKKNIKLCNQFMDEDKVDISYRIN